jgi:hypothetical protein
MHCLEFEQVLELAEEGSWPTEAIAHLEDCSDCHLLWDDIQAIRRIAKDLGAEEPDVPTRIWTSLRAQLESEGLVRDRAQGRWLAGWFDKAPRLVLAGAYVGVLLIAGLLVNYRLDQTTTSVPVVKRSGILVPPLAGLGNTLDGNIRVVMASFDRDHPDLAASFRTNLGIVDDLIAVCERSVREQPDNPIARDYLYGAYQQKAILLATAIDRSTLEDR